MKSNSTQIAIVLDKSGSMGSVRKATIDSINEFISGQKAGTTDVNLLFVQFDSTEPHVVTFDGPLQNFDGLNEDNYVPRDMTPLHDAMGWSITELGNRLSATPEDERPEKVVFVVLTDGLENASHEFTGDKVAELVQHQTDVYKWKFVFLGANQDAVLTAAKLNITSGSTLTYTSSARGLRSATGSVGALVDVWKYSSSFDPAAVNFSDADRKNAVQEESNVKGS